MKKFLVLSVILASQMSLAAPAREGKVESRETKAREAGRGTEVRQDQVRGTQVEAISSDKAENYTRQIAKNNKDRGGQAAQDAKVLENIANARSASDVSASDRDAVNESLNTIVKVSKNLGDKGGSSTAVLEAMAKERNLDADAIRKGCE